jgi:hypothetical protein
VEGKDSVEVFRDERCYCILGAKVGLNSLGIVGIFDARRDRWADDVGEDNGVRGIIEKLSCNKLTDEASGSCYKDMHHRSTGTIGF